MSRNRNIWETSNQMANNKTNKNNNNKILDIGSVLATYQQRPSNHNHSKLNILTLKKNDIVYVLGKSETGWVDVITINNEKNGHSSVLNRGWFPQNYIRSIQDNKVRNLHFNRLTHILSSNNNNNNTSLDLPTSSSSSSSINEAEQSLFKAVPMKKTKNISSSWQDSISTDNMKKNRSNNNQLLIINNPLHGSKLYSKEQIEKEFYQGQLTLSQNDSSKSLVPQPIIWQILINHNNNNNSNKTTNKDGNKLIYYNKELNIHCYHLPILIHPTLEKLKRDSIPNLKSPKPFLAKDNLFYNNKHDLVAIIDLFENALYSITLLKDGLMTRNKLKSWKIMKSISLAITYINLTVRQFEPFFISSMKREVRQLLKSILKYSSLIKLNANIHYTNDSLIGLDNNNLIPTTSPTITATSSSTNNRTSLSISSNLPNTSRIVSNMTSVSNQTDNTIEADDSLETSKRKTSNHTLTQQHLPYESSPNEMRMTSISSNYSKNSTIDLSARRDSSAIFNFDTLRKLNDLMFNHINNMQNSIQLLFYYIHNCVILSNEDKLILPQILPRFFTDSYGNGSWSNCFIDHLPSPTPSSTTKLDSKPSTTSISSMVSDGSTATTTTPNPLSPFTSKFISEQILQENFENFISPVSSINSNTGTAINSTIRLTPSASKASIALPSGSSRNPPKYSGTRSVSSTNPPKLPGLITKSKTRPNNRIYPLNHDTLRIMKGRKETLYNDMIKYMLATENSKPDVKHTLRLYTELNDHIINLFIVENIDLSFFSNLKNVLDTSDPADETIKLLKRIVPNIIFLLNSYFEVKQAFHDITTGLTITTQQATLEDPKVYNSMLPYHGVGSMERYAINNEVYSRDGFQEEKEQRKIDKIAQSVYTQLTKEDTDVDDLGFVNIYDEFIMSFSRYYDVNCAAFTVLEKLLEEKERIMNLVARTMQDTLIEELQKNEFKDATWFESDFSKEDITKPVNLTQIDSNDESLPWYLKCELQNSVVMDRTGKNIKSATKGVLVKYLVFSRTDGSMDAKFLDVFLLTFKSIFPSTADMVSAVISVYHSDPPEGLAFNEYNEWMERKLVPIKKNVVKVLRKFLKEYWCASYWELDLEKILTDFSDITKGQMIEGATDLANAISTMIRQSKKAIMHDPVEALNIASQCHLVPKANKGLRLSTIASAQFAQQITLINHTIYCQISVFECLDKVWGNQKNCSFGGSPNISKFIEHSNLLTNYVSYQIASQPDIKKRAKLISYFISVALYCQQLCNFATLTAIISALYSSPVYRLQKTWTLVSSDSKDILHKLDNLMDSKKNFINYRDSLRSVPKMVACVPFFGVYLSDLTFANSGNQDSGDMINFRKRIMIHDIIQDIKYFQKRTYITSLAQNADVQKFILEALKNIPDLDKQYELSLKMEPRGSSTSEERSKSAGGPKFWKKKRGIRLFG